MTYQIIFEDSSHSKYIQVLGDAIMKQAFDKKGFNPLDSLLLLFVISKKIS